MKLAICTSPCSWTVNCCRFHRGPQQSVTALCNHVSRLDVRIAAQDVVVGQQTLERAAILFLDGSKQSLLERDDVRIIRRDDRLGEECADKQ